MPPPERYDPPPIPYVEEGFDAVWLKWEGHTTFDGEVTLYKIHNKLKVLTERGAERYFEVKIYYSRYWHELEVHFIRTILPDGTVLEPPPESVLDVPIVRQRVYTDARQRIYYMPGVKPGCIIEYSFTIKARFPMSGEFQDWFIFQDWMPIRKAKYSLTLPEDYMMFLDWNVLQTNGIEELPLVFYSEGNTYTWELEKVPGVLPEYGMPPLEEIAPAIVVSSIMSWDEVGQWWWEMVEEVMEPDEGVREKTLELIEGKETEPERLAAIYHWVVKNIKYVALEFGIGGFKPLQPGVVLQNMYGDCKDSMILLLAMLRIAGIEAYPTLINVYGDVFPGFPSLWFDHAIVAVPLGEKRFGSEWLFLDGTASTNPAGDLPLADQAKWALIVGIDGGTRHELVQSPLYPPEWNKWRILQNITLNEDGSVNVTIRWETQGYFNRWWRYVFKALTEGQRTYFLMSYASLLVPGAELKWYEISDLEDYEQPIKVTLIFTGKAGRLYGNGERMMLKIPVLGPIRGLVKEEWRYYPLVIGAPYVIETVTVLTIPPGWEVEALPDSLSLEYYWGSIFIEYSYDGMVVISKVEEKINHKVIPRWMYNEWVDAQNEFAKHTEFPILIVKKH
jgi:transglutaminase-like putative cysteine protease